MQSTPVYSWLSEMGQIDTSEPYSNTTVTTPYPSHPMQIHQEENDNRSSEAQLQQPTAVEKQQTHIPAVDTQSQQPANGFAHLSSILYNTNTQSSSNNTYPSSAPSGSMQQYSFSHHNVSSSMNTSSASTSSSRSLMHQTRNPHAKVDKGPTKPVEFKFELAKRKSESRTADLSVQLQKELMEQCTFRPEIHSLPTTIYTSISSYSDTPFVERAMAWKENKRRESEKLAEERNKQEIEACTFRPNLNQRTAAVRNSSVFDGSSSNVADPSTVTERLYKLSFQKAQELEQLRVRTIEQQLNETCTFKPSVNKSPVTSRYRATVPFKGIQETPPELLECTFTPTINKTAPKSAWVQQYLDEPAFERLSRPRTPTRASLSFSSSVTPNSTSKRRYSSFSVMESPDVSYRQQSMTPRNRRSSYFTSPSRDSELDFFFQNQPNSGFYQHAEQQRTLNSFSNQDSYIRPYSSLNMSPSSAPTTPRRRHSISAARSRNSSEASQDSEESFLKFLQRQQWTEQRKKDKVEAIKASMTLKHQPSICKKSEQIVKATNKNSSFFDRLENNIQRSHITKTKQQMREDDEECTFKPEINNVSKSMKARGVEDMSHGDIARRKAIQAQIKMEEEKRESEKLTFTPKLNRNRNRTKGKLQITSDPDNYMQRLLQLHQKQSLKMRQLQVEQERKEAEECTFQPMIHDAPLYIRRTAQSVAMKKASMPPAPAKPVLPDWR